MTEIILMLISFVVTAIIATIFIPVLKKKKVGQIVREEGVEEHLKKNGTPTMGGIFFILSVTIILVIYSIYTKQYLILLPVISSLCFGIVGFIDDYKKLILKNTEGLSAKLKMLGLFIASAVFMLGFIGVFKFGTDIILPVISQPIVLPLIVFVLFTIIVLLATTNAVNFTDGIDGLASSVSIIILTFLTLIAIKTKQQEIAIFGSTLIGGVIAFLMFNRNPAKVFMGDTGSLYLGAAIAIMAIILKLPLYLILIAFIPLVEVVSVILQVTYFKATKGKRLFKMAPIHHHFELCGWSEKKVVTVFCIITLIMCIISYMI